MHLIGVEGMPRRVADYADQFATLEPGHLDRRRSCSGLSTLIFVYNMIASWRGGAARGGEPVARAHARVAGLLAAADLQLRRDPDRRRRPVRVRRARAPCTASSGPRPRASRPRHRARQPRRAEAEPREHHPRRRERDARRRASCSRPSARRPSRATSASSSACRAARPRTATSSTTTPSSRPRRCASTSRARSCASEGIDAIGEVGDPDPYTATMDAVAEYHPDEIIVSTLPGHVVGLAAARPRSSASSERRGPAGRRTSSPTSTPRACPSTSRSSCANRTAEQRRAAGARCKARRAGDEPRARCSSSSSRRRAATGIAAQRARGRLGQVVDRMRADGPARGRHDRRPRPLHGDDERAAVLPRRRHRHLDAARRPARAGCAPTSIERVRKASNKPVEHVVAAERPAAAAA